jgi:23S rRNA (cytidine2498-2'-O)-methyltransferase
MAEAILTADTDFSELALAEWRRDVSGPGKVVELAPGVLLVTFKESFWHLAEKWRRQAPVFVRHIFPVQATLSLGGSAADVATLRQATVAGFSQLLDPQLPFSVQTRLFGAMAYKPFAVNTALAEALEATGAPLDVRAPQQIVSVVVAAQEDGHFAYLGLSPTVSNLSDWAGGVRRFARDPEQISRSEFKLLEALELFAIRLPARGRALDLGAAPGGWTRVLRQREQYVTAVDPATLDPRLAQDTNVRHIRATAESYLQNEPDPVDLITNDMRLDARDSARLMVGYAPYLYRHGVAIMTLKLPENGRRQVIDHAFNILRTAYGIAGARQLFHNRSEITVYLKKKTSGA